LPEPTLDWFKRKPVEQLFDLKNDLWEQNNLIGNSEHAGLVDNLRSKLDQWMIGYYDTGLIEEGEYMTMAANQNTSVYEAVRQFSAGDYARFAEAAQRVGKVSDPRELIPALEDESSIVRFWALVAVDAFEGDVSGVDAQLKKLLNDEAWSVAGKAAEIRIKRFGDKEAYRVLEEKLKLDFEPVVLQAAISTRLLEEKAGPLLPAIQNDIMPKHSGDVWGRYRYLELSHVHWHGPRPNSN
jgi:N-sulfoglucosamine sulfohydrolase